jgi:chemotaxis protein CheD
MPESLMVGMAEAKVARSESEVLVALGLGSCIGLCIYDPVNQIGGLAHIVLPESGGQQSIPGKFADTAVPFLLKLMEEAGGSRPHYRAAIAGGAQLFSFNTSGTRLNVGPRNIQAMEQALSACNLRLVAKEVGGSAGRTVQMYSSGVIHVKTIGQREREWVNLAEGSFPPSPLAPMSTPP